MGDLHDTQMVLNSIICAKYNAESINDDVFRVVMHICSFLHTDLFTLPKPTMFTVNGSFKKKDGSDVDSDDFDDMDIITCMDVGGDILHIKSNYGELISDGYTPRIPKRKKSNMKKRRPRGNGTCFISQTSITVKTSLDKHLTVKMFRRLKYVIPGCMELDSSDAKTALKKIIEYINNLWPGCGYINDWTEMVTNMRNFKFKLKIPSERCLLICGDTCIKNREYISNCNTTRINLQALLGILVSTWVVENIAEEPSIGIVNNYPSIIVRFKSYRWSIDNPKLIAVCIQKSGKITINGSSSVTQYVSIHEWMNWIIYKYSDVVLWNIRVAPP